MKTIALLFASVAGCTTATPSLPAKRSANQKPAVLVAFSLAQAALAVPSGATTDFRNTPLSKDINNVSLWSNGFPGPGNNGRLLGDGQTSTNFSATLSNDGFEVQGSLICSHHFTLNGNGRFNLGLGERAHWQQYSGSLLIAKDITSTISGRMEIYGNAARSFPATVDFGGKVEFIQSGTLLTSNPAARFIFRRGLELRGLNSFGFRYLLNTSPAPIDMKGSNLSFLFNSPSYPGYRHPFDISFSDTTLNGAPFVIVDNIGSLTGEFTGRNIPRAYSLVYEAGRRQIRLVSTTPVFSQWATTAKLSGHLAAPLSTPFNDGVSNLLKYAFNMKGDNADSLTLDPSSGTSGLPTAVTVTSQNYITLRLHYMRRINSGLIYSPQFSSSLSSETYLPMTGITSATYIDPQWDRVTVEQSFARTSAPVRFVRVKVESN